MTGKIDISPAELAIVQDILRQHLPKGARTWAFGSRVTWTAKPFSDLDLAVEAASPLPLEVMGDLNEAFENSDLPWRVDVIDLKSVSPEFRAIVERQRVPVDWRPSTWGDEIVLEYGKAIRGYQDAIGRYRVFGTNGPVGWTDDALAKGPGVILGRKGAYRGVHFSAAPFWVIDTAYYVRPLHEELDMHWLFYAIQYHKLGEIDDGSPIPSTTRAAVYVRDFEVPSLPEQQAIAKCLALYDDKIELNRQMNQTLEAMARAVFLDWFVDFGPTRRKAAGAADPAAILGGLIPDNTQAAPLAALFPDSFGANGLPLGWLPKTLGDVVEPRKGRNITKKTVSHGTVPVVAGGLSPAYYHDTPNVNGPVITASASGANAGFVRLYNQGIWASDCSYISREQTDYLFTVYALLSSRQDEIYSMQQGAAQPHIYPSDLKRLIITDAPSPVWEASEALLAPMFELLANNEQENQTLAATRDLLLPKLMSGELRLIGGQDD